MRKRIRQASACGLLLLGLPLVARAGELDSIFDSLIEMLEVLLGVVLLFACLVLLLITFVRREPPVAAASPDTPDIAPPRLSESRVWRVALLAAAPYATALYLAATDSYAFADGRYLSFYGPFILLTLALMGGLWLFKRPSAAVGLGVSCVAVLILLSWQTYQWSQAGSRRSRPLQSDGLATYSLQTKTRIPDSLLNGVYTYVERMPAFVGGPDSLQQAIRRQLRYPPQALARRVQGTVRLGILVAEDGSVAAVELVRGIGAGCDEEAMRVASELHFFPGMQNGLAVRVYTTIEVYFKLP
jgi:TonB family protein